MDTKEKARKQKPDAASEAFRRKLRKLQNALEKQGEAFDQATAVESGEIEQLKDMAHKAHMERKLTTQEEKLKAIHLAESQKLYNEIHELHVSLEDEKGRMKALEIAHEVPIHNE
mmetsp:Transcript_24919/g.59941  ORF Transcript_24919/g.59941 Transcript_24919/m.59941 type:complete len:115 (+) Transcript_24919:752-1096(+)